MIIQKRGKNVAIAGAVAQLVISVVMLIIWLLTDSLSTLSCLLPLVAGIPLWLAAALLLYCRQLASQEAEELAELAAQGAETKTIFQDSDGMELRPAAARVAFVDKWFVPAFTLAWAGTHIALGLVLLRHLNFYQDGEVAPLVQNAPQGTLLLLVIGFAAFLFSRYCTGMSKRSDWRLLRSTGSYLLVNALLVAAALGALIAAGQGRQDADLLIAYLAPAMQLLLAAELLLNFVLDLYRPRIPGKERRWSFDSRLLNLVAEPERLGHSIADALNYQFGFEVSKTWFYKLLAKAALPLLAFGGLVLVGLTSFVVVRDGEEYVLSLWGRLDRVVGPGVSIKWPWPIGTARRFETGRVQQIDLGVGEKRKPTIVKGRELYLWTEEHGARKELDFMLAVPPRTAQAAQPGERKPPPPVNLIKLVVKLQYLVTDPVKFGYQFVDSAKLLECEAYRQMVQYCASATLDTPVGDGNPDRPEAMMTYGRDRVAAELKKRIQARADELSLGVNITYVGLATVHPPSEAAPAYEAVLEAERGMLLTRYEAEAEANKTLVAVAGTPLAALRLSLAIRMLEDLARLRDNPQRGEQIISELVSQCRDDVATLAREIEQERLLGQIREGEDETDRQKLQVEYLQYLDLLLKIQADPGKFRLDDEIADARISADELFSKTVGEPAKLVAEAVASRYESELTEMGRAQAFDSNLLAYKASPNIYMMDRWLDVWDDVLPGITKYVIGVDRDKLEIWLNWERPGDVMDAVTFDQEGTP